MEAAATGGSSSTKDNSDRTLKAAGVNTAARHNTAVIPLSVNTGASRNTTCYTAILPGMNTCWKQVLTPVMEGTELY